MSPARRRRRPAVREKTPSYGAVLPVRLLLDTHVWLWWNAADRRLGPRARAAIRAAGEVWFSVASAWEIGIKVSRRKLGLPAETDIASELATDGFRALSIDLRHVARAAQFPWIHRDPFDRIICAQASVEGLTLVTSDELLSRYSIPILSAAV